MDHMGVAGGAGGGGPDPRLQQNALPYELPVVPQPGSPPATSVCRSQMLCGEFVVDTHSFVRSPTGAHLSLVPIMSMELPAIVVLIVPVRPPGQYCSRVHNVPDAAAQAVFAEFHVFAPLGKAIHVGTTAQTCGTQRRKTSDRFSVGMAPVPERGPKKTD